MTGFALSRAQSLSIDGLALKLSKNTGEELLQVSKTLQAHTSFFTKLQFRFFGRHLDCANGSFIAVRFSSLLRWANLTKLTRCRFGKDIENLLSIGMNYPMFSQWFEYIFQSKRMNLSNLTKLIRCSYCDWQN